MKLLLPIACLALGGCATLTANCERALRGIRTASEIAAVLVSQGVEADRAQKVADALARLEIGVSVACAATQS